jgi:DNA transformation protein
MSTTRPLPAFTAHCLDLLASVGPGVARRMFGGWGISVDGITFAIIADLGDGERLWLKTDEHTLARFQAEGCPRFVYQAKGRDMALHYHAAPEAAMESPALMRDWALLAWQTALAAQARPQTKKNPRP